MRDSLKTTEGIVGMLASFGAAWAALYGREFPVESFVIVGSWIGGRLWEKSKTIGDPAKRAWRTWEFYSAMIGAIGVAIIDIMVGAVPEGVTLAIYPLVGFVGLRGVAKTSPNSIVAGIRINGSLENEPKV